jgi:hypothetical protein
VAVNATNGIWVDDFWEHSADIRAFMANPFKPGHPQFLSDDPHVFLNPFTFLVAMFGLAVGTDPIISLALFSIFNCCLLFTGLYLFISILDNKNKDSICFFTILLILFLSGNNPWQFSGFFNYQIFLSVLPLPSTFVMGISLIGLYLNKLRMQADEHYLFLVLLIISTISILSHPLTAIFLFSGMLAQALVEKKISSVISFSIFFIATFIVASLWPYFSIFNLMTSGGNTYHALNINLYTNIFEKIWPSLILLPFIASIFYERKNRSLLYTFVILIVIYIYGYVAHKYAYGRTISFILILIDIAVAQLLVKYEFIFYEKKHNLYLVFQTLFIAAIVSINFHWMHDAVQRTLTIANSIRIGRTVFNQTTYADYTFLSQYTKQNDLIMADLNSSWIIPAFSGKVVATMLPDPMVKDGESRTIDIVNFYDPNSSELIRCDIIRKYNPNFLFLINPPDSSYLNIFNQFGPNAGGNVIHKNSKFTLLKVSLNQSCHY